MTVHLHWANVTTLVMIRLWSASSSPVFLSSLIARTAGVFPIRPGIRPKGSSLPNIRCSAILLFNSRKVDILESSHATSLKSLSNTTNALWMERAKTHMNKDISTRFSSHRARLVDHCYSMQSAHFTKILNATMISVACRSVGHVASLPVKRFNVAILCTHWIPSTGVWCRMSAEAVPFSTFV